jgi:bacteriorhodopsin
MAGANSVNVNTYDAATQDITGRGAAWAYAVCALMWFTALVVFVWHLMIPRGHRLFHQLGVIVLVTAGIAYFAMGSALGRTAVEIEFSHANNFPLGTTRSIWYVRYIDWVITTPALLLSLLLASALPLSDILTIIFFDLVMIITGLVGALIPSRYKWAFWCIGLVSQFYIWWALLVPARSSAKMLGGTFQKTFTISAAILSFLWIGYPIAWGVADGGNVITADSEMIFYGVLDVLAKPVFLMIHLFLLSKEDLTHLQLSSGKYTSTSGVPADAEKFQPATAGTGNTSMPIGVNNGQKKGMFGRRGQYDATPATATHGHSGAVVDGRPSNATAVSP